MHQKYSTIYAQDSVLLPPLQTYCRWNVCSLSTKRYTNKNRRPTDHCAILSVYRTTASCDISSTHNCLSYVLAVIRDHVMQSSRMPKVSGRYAFRQTKSYIHRPIPYAPGCWRNSIFSLDNFDWLVDRIVRSHKAPYSTRRSSLFRRPKSPLLLILLANWNSHSLLTINQFFRVLDKMRTYCGLITYEFFRLNVEPVHTCWPK